METKAFDGRAEAQKIKEEIKKKLLTLHPSFKPVLAVVLVGDNLASLTYIKQKRKAGEEIGFGFELFTLPAIASFEEIRRQLLILISRHSGTPPRRWLNSQSSISGIILQLPLPSPLSSRTDELINFISPDKDVDGLTTNSSFTPPTALAVLHVLKISKVKIEGAQAVILGRGPTAGGPVADLLRKNGAHVSVIHSQTPLTLSVSQISSADIIVSCVGQPNLIKGEMIKEGAAVIGVGISRSSATTNHEPSTSNLVGDLDEHSLLGKASLITPTPGGIGPLTVAFLLKNLLTAAEKQPKDTSV